MATSKEMKFGGWQMKCTTDEDKVKEEEEGKDYHRTVGRACAAGETTNAYVLQHIYKTDRIERHRIMLYLCMNANEVSQEKNMCSTILVPFGAFSLEPHTHTHISYYAIILLLYY